jgi:type VI secretion system protein VasG
MISVGIKPLLGRLNDYCRKKLETSAGMCVARSHYEITVEHVIWQMLDDPSCDFSMILAYYAVNIHELKARLNDVLEDYTTGNSAKPVFSPRLIEWYQESQLVGSVELAENKIRSGALFLTLLGRTSQFAAPAVSELFKAISKEDLLNTFRTIVKTSCEDQGQASGEAKSGPEGKTALQSYCEDFTEKARKGLIDPVFGRDSEIRQVVDIFARRRKNNPILVGEPGVGKTAIAEGLALRIIEGDVPDFLKNIRLMTLDLGLLQAGADVKGEFENRLKKVIEEVRASTTPIIMFIDEAHTLIGAGASAGGSDAANLLKPALARGELRTIAATTWSEYKKYFEKDAALARRFQLVYLEEPSVEDATLILRGLRVNYEKAHGVIIRDDAVKAASELSSRYISGRYLPDKAIDLLDTSAARVKVLLTSKPGAVENLERSLQAEARELEALDRDRVYGVNVDNEHLHHLKNHILQLEGELAVLTVRWKNEQSLATQLISLREQLYEMERAAVKPVSRNESDTLTEKVTAKATKKKKEKKQTPDQAKDQAKSSEPSPDSSDPISKLKLKIRDVNDELKSIQGSSPLIQIEVEPKVVSRVVSDWTGIPVGQMLHDEARNIMDMEPRFKKRVKGQDQAISEICRIIRAAKAGLKDPGQPLGVFLLTGPSGVGKTETGLAMAELLFGGERFTLSVNMSEFQEKHTVSRLIGSPPGYVGYGEGGVLTEAVRQRPYSVVLLDEAEKANTEVLNLFYQVFDKGVLADGEGRNINFKNTVIFMTSNLGSELIAQASAENPDLSVDELVAYVRPVLSKHFKPALLARMTLVPFRPLSTVTIKEIVSMKLRCVVERMKEAHHVDLVFTGDVEEKIAARCLEVETGARNIDHILDSTLLPLLSQEILDCLALSELPSQIKIQSTDNGLFEIVRPKAAKTKKS